VSPRPVPVPAVAPSSLFTYKDGVLSAEASDLTLGGHLDSRAEREGFWVRSERTGEQRFFVPAGVERDREGDVVAWHFKCWSPLLKLVIFND
jgi:hypothetical protein